MLAALGFLLDGVELIGSYVLWALISAVNLVVVAVGAAIATVVGLLPAMPTPPSAPSGGILGFLNWVVALGPLLTFFTICVGLWLSFLAVRILARWVRVL